MGLLHEPLGSALQTPSQKIDIKAGFVHGVFLSGQQVHEQRADAGALGGSERQNYFLGCGGCAAAWANSTTPQAFEGMIKDPSSLTPLTAIWTIRSDFSRLAIFQKPRRSGPCSCVN